MVFTFTHTVPMDWMLPGIAPTGKRVEVPLVAIVGFMDGKIAHEQIHEDQTSVLVQIGLLDPATLPVAGIASADKVRDPSRTSRELPLLTAGDAGEELAGFGHDEAEASR